MPVPTPAPTFAERFDITLPNSIQIPTSLPYGITLPQSIAGLSIPTGITLQYTPAPASVTSSSVVASSPLYVFNGVLVRSRNSHAI
jgi:hypothetical protein